MDNYWFRICFEKELESPTDAQDLMDSICKFIELESFVVHIFRYNDGFKICLTTKKITMCYITPPLEKEEVDNFWKEFRDKDTFIETEYFQLTFSPAELEESPKIDSLEVEDV